MRLVFARRKDLRPLVEKNIEQWMSRDAWNLAALLIQLSCHNFKLPTLLLTKCPDGSAIRDLPRSLSVTAAAGSIPQQEERPLSPNDEPLIGGVLYIFLNALSKSAGSSDAPMLRAVSTKRAWRSASVSLGIFGFGFFAGCHVRHSASVR